MRIKNHDERPPQSEQPPIKNDDGKFESIWLTQQWGRQENWAAHRMVSMQISTWIRGARPQTLPLGLAPVLVGVAASWRWDALGGLRSCPAFPGGLLEERDAGDVLGHCAFSRPWFAVVAMLCAVVAVGLQIAVNYLNDYADGVRGTDARRGSDAAGPRRLTPVACCWLPRSPL